MKTATGFLCDGCERPRPEIPEQNDDELHFCNYNCQETHFKNLHLAPAPWDGSKCYAPVSGSFVVAHWPSQSAYRFRP